MRTRKFKKRFSVFSPGGSAIASILVDGYNLIGTGHRNLEKARESLRESLGAYRRMTGHEIVLVFDGHKGGTVRGSRDVRSGIVIMYTGQGESADDAIKRMITEDRREWIVISSDRAIGQYAWSHGAVPVPSARFEAILIRMLSVGTEDVPAENEDADDDADHPSGGNARRLSKKDRALRRAIGKLSSTGVQQ